MDRLPQEGRWVWGLGVAPRGFSLRPGLFLVLLGLSPQPERRSQFRPEESSSQRPLIFGGSCYLRNSWRAGLACRVPGGTGLRLTP